MKKVILFFFIFFLGIFYTSAQNTVAKLKFEDAEKAFNDGNYQNCITLLDETEKILGTTAPNILYLRIMAEGKVWEAEPYANYEKVIKLQHLCNTYMQKYDIAGLEGKYRDVYELSGKLPKAGNQVQLIEMGKQYEKEQQALKAEKATADNNLVFVEGGTFMMGEGKEAHEVTLDDYYIGRYEITLGEFHRFNENHKDRVLQIYKERVWIRWNIMGDVAVHDDFAANCISWDEAMAYCKWLEKQYGGTWRLPTEAEWEYAARGGNKSQGYKFSGSNKWREVAIVEKWYEGPYQSSDKFHASLGGKRLANELGIYDMTGNVNEWCYDWYDSDYFKKNPKENPMGPETGKKHVLRGGSWYSARTNYDRFSPIYNENRDSELIRYGFRVVYIPE